MTTTPPLDPVREAFEAWINDLWPCKQQTRTPAQNSRAKKMPSALLKLLCMPSLVFGKSCNMDSTPPEDVQSLLRLDRKSIRPAASSCPASKGLTMPESNSKVMEEIERFAKIECDGSFLICELTELNMMLGQELLNGYAGVKYTVSAVEMTRDQYEHLFEFEGF